MTDLEITINYWQSILDLQRYLLEPSVQLHIERTIKHLKQLQEIVSHVQMPK